MFVIIGSLIVLGSVIGGYILEHGNLHVLWQPIELLIILGAAVGSFVIGAPLKIIKASIAALIGTLKGKAYSKADYMDLLLLFSDLFAKARKMGFISIESDVEKPDSSPIFTAFPKFMANHHAMAFMTDTLRTVISTSIPPHELEALLDADLEILHEELVAPAHSINTVADSLPGLGIVAAVLGVVITMGKIKEPPEVLGHSIGAALVGTFLGILMCYGFGGPLARNIEAMANEEKEYMNVIKVTLIAFVGGMAPPIAIEFGRRVVPMHVRPSFAEVEEAIGQRKK